MDSDRPSLGTYLRAARTKAGLSVREAARLGSISHGYLTKLENDQQANPSADVLLRMADVYELDAGKVLEYVGITSAAIVPTMEVVFRKQYGLTEEEAKEAAELIEERYGKRGETNT